MNKKITIESESWRAVGVLIFGMLGACFGALGAWKLTELVEALL